MNCIIIKTLERFKHKIGKKSTDVLSRYIKIKLKIDISQIALQQKLALII